MRRPTGFRAPLLASILSLTGCADMSKLPESAAYGPDPQLPEPRRQRIPTVHVAKAIGWPPSAAPTPAPGLAVQRFAGDLQHPRWLYVLPNGDVLVAESDAPSKPEKNRGIRARIMDRVMKYAGSRTVSPDRITLLRDANGDGIAEVRSSFLEGLSSPFGMELVGDFLYIANTDALLRFPYTPGTLKINEPGVRVTDLPGGPINHHWTKNVIASPDGTKLYVAVGSNSNVGENGMANEERRAAILEVDAISGVSKVFASGLRNPVGMAWEPVTGVLWTVVNERDEIGSDLVPDYLTSVKPGGFYGWPYSYYGNHVDPRVRPSDPAQVARAIKPDYALGNHTASLGLTFYQDRLLPERYWGGAFIGQHGSWNRKPHSGYKVVFIPFSKGRPSGPPADVLTGFLNENGEAQGRPVGVVVDRDGALLVADDVGNTVWRVTQKPGLPVMGSTIPVM